MDQAETTASFGYWVRRQRLALDLTQAELARRVGCARITISKIERDERRPSRQMAELLAEHLQLPAEERTRFLAIALGEEAVSRLPLTDRPQTDDAATAADRPPSNLPVPSTPFVGRQRELDLLVEQLQNPACRLLTLAGPGGFGKTRLAIRLSELAREQRDLFAEGVFFVALEGLESCEWTIPAIAAALDFTLAEQRRQEAQLLRYLADRRLLLVLDNAQEILEPALVEKILMHAPGVKILVTAREALSLQEEWFHPIGGMSLDTPQDDDGDDAGATEADAVAFFHQCALRARPDFDLTRELDHVRTICRLVEGAPLAIELAAAWLRSLSCEQVAQELAQSLDFLTTPLRNVPARHRSLRAVLEQSWRYLIEEETRVFRQLAVFPGSFRPDAAQTVTDASLATLASLVDKAVLRLRPNGRYRIHALMRQTGSERLAARADEEEAVQARHSGYYLIFLDHRRTSITGPDQRAVLVEVGMELPNIRAAWRYAAGQHDVASMAAALPALSRYLWLRGRYEEGAQLMASALEALPAQTAGDATVRMRIELGARLAHFVAATGDTGRAASILADAQAQLDATGDDAAPSPERALCFYVAGMIATYEQRGDAFGKMKAAYEVYGALGDVAATAEAALRLQFIVSWIFGDFAAARALAEESQDAFRQQGDVANLADAADAVANVSWVYGDYDGAEASYQTSLAHAQDVDNPWVTARAIGGLSFVAFAREDWDLAIAMAEERLARMLELGHTPDIDISRAILAEIYVYAEDYVKAAEIIDAHPVLRTWPWYEQALIGVGRYGEAMPSLMAIARDIVHGQQRWRIVDDLASWALLLLSHCPLFVQGEPLSRSARRELARETLAVASDYDPDRSLAVSRKRAAKLLDEMGEVEGTEPAPRALTEIAQELVTIRLDEST